MAPNHPGEPTRVDRLVNSRAPTGLTCAAAGTRRYRVGVHPIERLRFVARANHVPERILVDEAAAALTAFGDDRPGLVTACRRIIERHCASGALMYLAASAVVAPDPLDRIDAVAADLAGDPTARHVARHLPPDAAVVMVGWPPETPRLLGQRGDCTVVVVDDTDGNGTDLVSALVAADVDAGVVDACSLGQAVAGLGSRHAGEHQEKNSQSRSVAVVEAHAMGPGYAMAAPGSLALAATAQALGVAVWVVAPVGRVQPGPMWERFTAAEHGCDLVPLELCDTVVRPTGVAEPGGRALAPDCPNAPELFVRTGP